MREVSGSELAELSGRTWRTVKAALELAGVRPRRRVGRADMYDSEAALNAIYRPAGSDLEFDNQRERLAAAQAEKVEHENAIRRGELARRSDVIAFWTECVANMRAKALAMAAKLGPRLTNVADAQLIAAAVRAEVTAFLAELADWEPAGVVEDHAEDRGPAADTDGQRVGRPRTKAQQREQRGTGPMAD